MSEQEKKLDGPDFAQGVPFGDLAERSMIVGHVAGEAVVLICVSDPQARCGFSGRADGRYDSTPLFPVSHST